MARARGKAWMVMAGALLALLAARAGCRRAGDEVAAYKRAVEQRFAQWLAGALARR